MICNVRLVIQIHLNELLWLLTKCKLGHHVKCVDTWLLRARRNTRVLTTSFFRLFFSINKMHQHLIKFLLTHVESLGERSFASIHHHSETTLPVLSHLYLMMRFGKLTIQENKATTNQASSFVILLW
ncbi:uncharacterized protein LOC110885971 isoform X1 [Helianthus annuus]|uniref:uncharacterized protein LOC110885971 isoform X1 n=1 Tax=Helianthus annuus TaxID=4232 RepID=UPI000B9011AB|nr:uncharacterized protein LOC110885971 isoform X1 [Helianthus annuus]